MGIDCCPDCGYAITAHFRQDKGGRWRGCPWASVRSQVGAPVLPRAMLRRPTSGPHRGSVVVAWLDYYDPATDEVLLWALDTDEQWAGTFKQYRDASRLVRGLDQDRTTQTIETKVGGPIRVCYRRA